MAQTFRVLLSDPLAPQGIEVLKRHPELKFERLVKPENQRDRGRERGGMLIVLGFEFLHQVEIKLRRAILPGHLEPAFRQGDDTKPGR